MSKKEKPQSEFWKKVHFKYRLSAINENTLEEVWKIKASMFSGAVLFLFVAFMLIAITSMIIVTTPIRYYLPGYLDVEIREKAVKSAIKIDSLEHIVNLQDAYIDNIRRVLSGTLPVDSVIKIDSTFVSEDDPILEKSQREREFTARYDEEEKYTLGVFPASATSGGALFYKPVNGVLIKKFNAHKKDYKVVIKTAKTETVRAALEGSVIFTGYDIESLHVIHLQHKNGYISIYKGCSQLTKKVGDKVRTAEAIGVVVEREAGVGSSLSFELWEKGVPANPETLISF